MPTRIKTARVRSSKVSKAKLTAYESAQVRQIAAWKSQSPNPFAELFKKITMPGAKLAERLMPDQAVRVAFERSYDAAKMLAGEQDTKRHAGVKDLSEMRKKPLEECDRVASRISADSRVWATVEGAATGAGGVLTTLLDVPLLFILSLRAILKIAHCYGYPLAERKDRHFVLGVLIAATSGSLETKRRRLDELHDIEEFLIQELQEEVVAEEVLSFLFQLEIFEEVPGVGAISGALLNLAFIRRVDHTARRVFQERWLRDNGKVRSIAPAAAHERDLAIGWSGALGRAAYSGCYLLGFGVALPASIVASLMPSTDNALMQGLRAGGAGAQEGVDKLLEWARGETARAPDRSRRRSLPAPA
jgi:hypothetical protein